MRLTNTLVGTAAALILASTLASPAIAATGGVSLSEAVPVVDTTYDDSARATLEDLTGTQSAAEIDILIGSGAPIEALLDSETGEFVAARVVEETSRTAQKITPRPSGCLATDACATNSSDHGYSGLGSLTISLSNVTKVTSGNAYTFWTWAGGDGAALQPNLTVYLDAPVTMQLIERM